MNRDNIKRRIASGKETLEVHEHCFISGPRRKSGYGKDGKWHTCGETIRHSHPGGNVPHNHPHTGPSYYGYRTPKVTKRPIGEQGLEVIPRTDEENSFDLVITDSAKYFNEKNEHVPIGNTPIEHMRMFAAESMKSAFRMKCNVRDERKNGGAA